MEQSGHSSVRETAACIIPGALDADRCRRWREAMTRGGAEPADVLDDTFARREEVRRVLSIEPDAAVLRDVGSVLDAHRAAIGAFYGVRLGEREGAGFLRYADGGFYRRHRDRAVAAVWPDAARRLITVVLFLNGSRPAEPDGEFSGGVLRVFAPSRTIDIEPRTGLLAAFPAELVHEVTAVRGGIRDTVVDWFYPGV